MPRLVGWEHHFSKDYQVVVLLFNRNYPYLAVLCDDHTRITCVEIIKDKLCGSIPVML
jgi:hypothetical protein